MYFISVGHRRLPSVSDDISLPDADDSKYDVSVTDVDLSQTCQDVDNLAGLAASVDQSPMVTDDTDDEDSEIFEIEKSSTELSTLQSAITADNEYSSIDVGTDLIAEGGMSTSSSSDALSSAVVSQITVVEHKYTGSSDIDDVFRQLPVDALDPIQQPEAGSSVVRLRVGDIGTLTDVNEVPAIYLVRLLCSEFLLTGYQCVLMPDRSVRVSVKALALVCIACIVDICPRTFIIKLHKASSEPGTLLHV